MGDRRPPRDVEARDTFDTVARLYDAVRPAVPTEILEALQRRVGFSCGKRVLEVGCGTGLLTRDLAARGLAVTALDPGKSLLAVCAERSDPAHDVTYVADRFEDYASPASVEAVICCQAAHWIEPRVFLDRAVKVLSGRGSVSLIWHLDVSENTTFWRATQPLYDRHMPTPAGAAGTTLADHLDAYETALVADPRFSRPTRDRHAWTRSLNAAEYLGLLRTHSPVRMLEPEARRAFLAGHEVLIAEGGGRVDRHFVTTLLTSHTVPSHTVPGE